MADKKITALTAVTSLTDDDLFVVVDDPSGTATTKKITAANVKSGLAPLASPTFTGTPAAPTAAADTNTTQIATTAYVVGQGYAKLASPTLTGTPAAPTAAADTNTTQIATTAYVVGQGYLKSSTASTTYVANSLVDAKGDLIVATADNTVTRLAVGATNNHVLMVDSSAATGIKWAAAPAPTITWEDDQNILANAIFS